jgi:ParB-like chromosome segregation protein Spo0J
MTAKLTNTDVSEIVIPQRLRDLNPDAVTRMVESIRANGLHTPITTRYVVEDGKRTEVLVAGRHRLEAFRQLNEVLIPTFVFDGPEIDAQLWEIAENLHRSDLTYDQREQHLARWIKLTNQKLEAAKAAEKLDTAADDKSEEEEFSATVAENSKPKAGRPEGGVEAAARELGVAPRTAQRAVDHAEIAPEAREKLAVVGIEPNARILNTVATARRKALKAGLEPEAVVQAQVEAVEKAVVTKPAPTVRRPSPPPTKPTAAVYSKKTLLGDEAEMLINSVSSDDSLMDDLMLILSSLRGDTGAIRTLAKEIRENSA